MSPKKKLAPTKSAPKDDLIDALYESESAGPASSKKHTQSKVESINRLADRRPPPPPPVKDSERIYDFNSDFNSEDGGVDDDVTRSVAHSTAEPRIPTFDPPPASEDTRPLSLVREPTGKMQKLEDVLRRIKNQPPSQSRGPLFDPDTAALEALKKQSEKSEQIGAVRPPPIVELEVPAVERAPTEPVDDKPMLPEAPQSSDEKTVAVNQQSVSNRSEATADLRPIWRDAKTDVLVEPASSDNPESDPEGEQFMPTEIRVGSPGARFREEARLAQPGAAIFSSSEAALRQSENLRVAQKRISELENELERVRRENESVRSAGETLRRRMDELQAHAENAELNTQEAKKMAEEERKVLKGQIQSRDREIAEMKGRIDDAENRLESNFRKIRVRERDLEHRIEIIKAESQSITASKDRMILELKRQIDQISSELNHSKAQVQETFGQFKEKQETARRAVRALRIALTVLEGEEDSGARKAE